jgi:hypothetical protein
MISGLMRSSMMKNRIGIFWLAALTVYMAYTTTDTYTVLKNVQTNQYYTLTYMEKSANILKRLKNVKMIESAHSDEDDQSKTALNAK